MLALLLVASLPGGARPAAPEQGPTGALTQRWRWRIFDSAEGLGAATVTVLYQAVDDFLYAATEQGLFRYDLHFWTPVDGAEALDGEPIIRIVESIDQIYCATRGTLWAVRGDSGLRRVYPGSDQRGGRIILSSGQRGEVFVVDAGERRHLRIPETRVDPMEVGARLPLGAIRDYRIDAQGGHWLATDVGLFRLDPETFLSWSEEDAFPEAECLGFLEFRGPPRGPAPTVRRLSEGRRLWALFRERRDPAAWFLARLDGGVWTRLPDSMPGSPVESVTVDLGGNHYATCEDGRLLVLPAASDRWLRCDQPGVGKVKLYGVIVDMRGSLWFRHGSGGVTMFDPESRRWRRLTGMPDPFPSVESLLETSGGELWVGTEKQGVYRYTPVSRPAGDAGSTGYEMREAIGDVTGEALLEVSALGEEYLGEDIPGRVWIGSRAAGGVFFVDLDSGRRGKQEFQHSFHRIVTDRRRELWFLPSRPAEGSTSVAIYRKSIYTGGRFEEVAIRSAGDEPEEEPARPVLDLVRSRSDRFWLATDEGVLLTRLDREGGSLVVERRITVAEGLRSSGVRAIAEGPEGALWIAHVDADDGVSSVRGGSVRHHGEEDGFPVGEVWSIARSGQSIWFGTQHGLARFDGQCWYSFPVASAEPHSSRVGPIFSPRRPGEEESLVVGTREQGVLILRSDDRRKPRVDVLAFPETASAAGDVRFDWRARDYKNQTEPGQLVVRYRLDGGPWKVGLGVRSAVFAGLEVGTHTFDLEVRDLGGFRNWRRISHQFVVPSRGIRSTPWPLVLALSFVLVAILALLLVRFRSRGHQGMAVGRYVGFWREHPDAIFCVDREGRIQDYNGRLAAELGLERCRPEDILGRPLRMVPALAPLEIDDRLTAALRGEEFEVLARPGAGGGERERVLEVRGFSLRPRDPAEGARGGRADGAEAPCVMVVVEDLTHEEEVSRLRARERRLAGLRDLASRVGCDLDSLLTHLESRRGDAEDPSDPELSARLERLRSTARTLSDFARPAAGSPAGHIVDLDAILGDLTGCEPRGGGASLGVGVRVDYRPQVGLWPVRADEERLREALRAVIENGAEAMPDGGSLTVRVTNRRLEADPGHLPPGSYVEVRVRDEGPGIDPGRLDSVFDPFFSTKPRDRADGAGLSRAYGLARSFGGDIRVHSVPGEGTTVRFLLPAVREA